MQCGSAGFTLDGDPRPSWVLLEQTDHQSRITIRRVDYNVNEIMSLIDATPDFPDFEDANFNHAYKMMLKTGRHWKTFI